MRDGFVFLGRYIGPEGGVEITTGPPHGRDGDFTLDAPWIQIPTTTGPTTPVPG